MVPTAARVTVEVLATVGDRMPGSGEPFAPLVDGIGIWSDTAGLHLMINHELSGVDRIDGGEDFPFSMVSRVEIDPRSRRVVDHSYVLDGSEGYLVLCSAAWVDTEDGFPGGYFFTGEELEDGGRQLAIDAQGIITEMPWVGHYAHENQISVPGFPNHAVLLNFDDSSADRVREGRSTSELYMFAGTDSRAVMRGEGQLYVFAPQAGQPSGPSDLTAGQSVAGAWKPIPRDVALNTDASALQAYVDSIGVFEFVRLEDGWYDKRPGHAAAALFFDTGRNDRVLNTDGTGPGDPWGSLYYLAFDPQNPAGNTTLTLLSRSSGPESGWASPDNGDMNTAGTIMLQEDPANFPFERPPAMFRMNLIGTTGVSAATRVAAVFDPDCAAGRDCVEIVKYWETSGIVDASEWFGADHWIFDVQAHTKPVAALGLSAENGQLLLLHAPQD
ncbi:MAG: hypothetical protein ACE5FP_09095 [Gemmatimonadota bacterium]